jgi:hypothetical protein
MVLCKSKGKTIVEYALKDADKPIGVATYRVDNLPSGRKSLKGGSGSSKFRVTQLRIESVSSDRFKISDANEAKNSFQIGFLKIRCIIG